MNSFATPDEMAQVRAQNARIEVISSPSGKDRRALRVEFQPAAWPGITLRPTQPWNFRGYGELLFDVTNPGEAVTLNVRIDDDARADGVRFCRSASIVVAPGATRTVAFRFEQNPRDFGMHGLPSYPDALPMRVGGAALDYSHILQAIIFLASPKQPRTLLIENVRLRSSYPLNGLLDQFGQFTGADWPGKIHSMADLAARREAERRDLEANPTVPERDRFGGWSAGPKLKRTGFFRVEKRNGKWWLVTPDGTLFFSTGFNEVSPAASTFVTGREPMFTWLPEAGDPLARFFGRQTSTITGRTYDFLGANIQRKYPDGVEDWLRVIRLRMRSWGFNTVGNWSNKRTWPEAVHVTTCDTSGKYHRIPTVDNGTMPDVFDPAFTTAASARTAFLADHANDPWVLGHFVDNELRWGHNGKDTQRYAIALGTLREPSTPAYEALLAQLRTRYTDIAALNAAWKTDFATWQAVTAPKAFNDAIRADFAAFITEFARRYFRTVRDAVKARDPNHLYLGPRFAWYTTEAVNAAAEFTDVVSFNIYKPRIDDNWDFVNALGKPCIIGEFHMGALDRGMFHTGLVSAANQQDRAAMFQDYLRSVARHPAFVGAHWFELNDESTLGRWFDGENYNIGFLSITDTPYPEMVDAARKLHREIYLLRLRK